MGGGSFFLTLFLGLFFAIGFGILGFALRSMHMAKQAEHWPTVPGEVISSDFDIDSGSESTTYRANISYAYNVDGRDFTNEKIAFGYTGSSNQKFHRNIHDALPAKAQIAVRYDPADPSRAVLSFGVHQTIMFLMLFGATWTLFTAGMAAMFWLDGQGAGGLVENIIVFSRR